MGILSFPIELLLSIADAVPIKDLPNLLLSCRDFQSLLSPQYLFHCLAKNTDEPIKPLQWAAEHGLASLAELAISRGAEIDKRGQLGRTPLQVAAINNRPTVIRVLLKHGASIAPVSHSDESPLYLAAKLGKEEATRALLELGKCSRAQIFSAAFCAVRQGNLDCVKAFIDAGFDLSARDTEERTILHQVFRGDKSSIEVLEYLLAQDGASKLVNAVDRYACTPLNFAVAKRGRAKHVRLLLRHGADMWVKDYLGGTPAQKVASMGGAQSMRAVLDASCDRYLQKRALMSNRSPRSRIIRPRRDGGVPAWSWGQADGHLLKSYDWGESNDYLKHKICRISGEEKRV